MNTVRESTLRGTPTGREPFTILFLGSFRHIPNQEALTWFVEQALPLVLTEEPRARVMVVGSDPPPRSLFRHTEAVELIGFVEDVRDPLARYSLFVCPILSGSGMRVKLLEAFAAGIPVVSTRLGAEGLTDRDGEICALADQPVEFARHVIDLLRDPQKAAARNAERERGRETRYPRDDGTYGEGLSRRGRAQARYFPLIDCANFAAILLAVCLIPSGVLSFGNS